MQLQKLDIAKKMPGGWTESNVDARPRFRYFQETWEVYSDFPGFCSDIIFGGNMGCVYRLRMGLGLGFVAKVRRLDRVIWRAILE